MILNNIISVLKEAKSVAILPHISVDGDGLGSSLALGLVLKKLNKEAVIYLDEDIPGGFNFLPGSHLVEKYIFGRRNFKVAVALDTGDIERLGQRAEIFKDADITVNIDHHNTNCEFAFYNYIKTSASAVGEIIYQIIKMMGIAIDSDISTCLYVAIATDTGGFRFSNTTSLTHQITADLINSGVNVAEISQRIFDATSLEKVKLVGAAIGSLELLEKGKVAFITLTNEIMAETGAKEEDCDGIVNIGRNILGVEVAAMFRPLNNGEVKVNLRSKSYVDVSAIANLYFGGGHRRAAGYMVKGEVNGVKRRLLDDIREVLAQI